MKRLLLFMTVAVSISVLGACGSSPYKKRKSCRGNGSWYGKRNLGAVQPPTTTPKYHVENPTVTTRAL